MKRLTIEVNNVICEVIATYHNDKSNKDYIVYTDKTFDKNKKLNVYYGLYENINNKIIVRKIENDNDNRIVQEILKEIIRIN